jgi:preprotein translocase subunit YajC
MKFFDLVDRFAHVDLVSLLLLAQGEKGAGKAAEGAGGSVFDNLGMFAPILIIMVLFYFLMMRPQQRERAEMQKLLDSLKKNDRVLMRSGIVGTIVNIQKDSRYATVKIDESTNTKVRVLRAAIEKVLTDEVEEVEKKDA